METTTTLHKFFLLATISCLLLQSANAQNSGRIVLNEYMPWTSNGCGSTAEFVELINMGPGPINIGCYILTDGDYTVTIPPNTIVQPGEFYLIAGQSILSIGCANIDSSVTADLNWNTCGCTNAPIPSTGDGFFTDGGGANEPVVLLDPNLNVVDAVVRSLPTESAASITTSSVAGACTPRSFDLDLLPINYEILGMSTGRANSFARKIDGDCEWVKDPQQSGNATNNRSGETSDVSYSLTVVNAMDCDTTHGSVNISINTGGASNVFPVKYTMAFDSDRNNVFGFSDTYTTGVDSTPSSILIGSLAVGRYSITVGSSADCYLKTLNFQILPCSNVLPLQLSYFKLAQTIHNTHTFEWNLLQVENTTEIILQKSSNGTLFVPETSIYPQDINGSKTFTQTVPVTADYNSYRLHIIDKRGKSSYSTTISPVTKNNSTHTIWPNPAKEKINIQLMSDTNGMAVYRVYNLMNSMVMEGSFSVSAGTNNLQLKLNALPSGIYQAIITTNPINSQPISFRFIKQ